MMATVMTMPAGFIMQSLMNESKRVNGTQSSEKPLGKNSSDKDNSDSLLSGYQIKNINK